MASYYQHLCCNRAIQDSHRVLQEFNLFSGLCSLISQLNDVEKKLFETEERADLAEVKVSSRKEGRKGKGAQFDC